MQLFRLEHAWWIVNCINDVKTKDTPCISYHRYHIWLCFHSLVLICRAKYGSQYTMDQIKTSFQYLSEGCTNRHLSNVKHNPMPFKGWALIELWVDLRMVNFAFLSTHIVQSHRDTCSLFLFFLCTVITASLANMWQFLRRVSRALLRRPISHTPSEPSVGLGHPEQFLSSTLPFRDASFSLSHDRSSLFPLLSSPSPSFLHFAIAKYI